MGRDVRPTAEDGPPDPEGADPQGQDKRDGSRGDLRGTSLTSGRIRSAQVNRSTLMTSASG